MISEKATGTCYNCGEITDWRIVHRVVSNWGIRHCFQCEKCGKIVPDFAWDRYQSEGRVVIPV